MTHYIDTKKLIADIQMRPALWNRNYAVNKAFTEDTWDELSEIHQLPKSVLKTRWKSLRDNFRIEFKRLPRDADGNFLISPKHHTSKWAYYRPLLFLVDHMKSRNPPPPDPIIEMRGSTSSNMGYSDVNEPDDDYIQIPDVPSMATIHMSSGTSSIDLPPNAPESLPLPPLVPVMAPKKFQPLKRLRTEENDSNSSHSNGVTTVDEPKDDDYHFLMSLHTFMTQMKTKQKLKMRMKIQELIYEEIGKIDDSLKTYSKDNK